MDARETLNEIDLAAYELAEAQRHERAASKHRMNALKHNAKASEWMRGAIADAEQARGCGDGEG